MNKENRKAKAPKHPAKMVFNAFTPVGAPRTPERERYYLSYSGIDEGLSDRGGENHAG